jgi:hypothetical protein
MSLQLKSSHTQQIAAYGSADQTNILFTTQQRRRMRPGLRGARARLWAKRTWYLPSVAAIVRGTLDARNAGNYKAE